MRPSVIKAKLSRGEPVLLTQLHFTDPSVFEMTSLMGFDGIWMDLEHHTYSMETATALMRAARVGRSDILARPAKGEFMRISRLLEAGAQGIMYPRCDDAAEAAEVVKWAKFAPLGKRGFDGGNPDMPYCTMPMKEYIKLANEQTFVLIQLEEQHAVDRADEIAAVPGVDVLFLGPADFTVLSGFPGEFDHPVMRKAVEKIASAARKAGKHWGMPGFSVEHTKQLLEMGATFICHMADLLMVKQGLEQIQRQFAPLGFTFHNGFCENGKSYVEGR
ncbi:MAG TPA: aldolase/citrate lyase family protein [Phycisphaerae bacterium]|jgi:4-hydroxy-2-oxoheptanedioate aldolase|nr:aldolase [Phycisphaerae bacterium]HOB76051.1 aldolase/citrate lyase family protein [Phycisphaerae bacterium]HOJ54451.1 aldolase/citrate lyase family protein [Phycisphaerae bacterium]HOL26234.1 aldolase/citrate lyase family protein [Phycisphaerae bacterium]HPP20759.1 aldolase/citrate lyase family protein [Phycisphaerae bacterium]